MAIYPKATWRKVAWAAISRGAVKPTVVVLHSTASEATSQYNYFNTSKAACSHFHVDRFGNVEQYIDTANKSCSETGAGNPYCVSIETQSDLNAKDPWTAAQETAIVELLQWLNKTHGIPLVAKTKADKTAGIGWHRLGVNGNFPALPSVLAGRTQRGGGDLWSSATGKTCPGDARITQIPGLIARAGGATTTPQLTVDGVWGRDTTLRLQQVLGTAADGVISDQTPAYGDKSTALVESGWEFVHGKSKGGSNLVRAIQKRLGLTQDGVFGPATGKALQAHYGFAGDGYFEMPNSNTIKAMQKALNAGKF